MSAMDAIWRKLVLDILAQAIEDSRVLCEYGIIVKGQCLETWPAGVRRVLNYYDCVPKVEGLIRWLNSEEVQYLLDLGVSDVSPSQVRKAAGLE